MRYTGPKCRLCRREGKKLFLKGERCETGKCAILTRGTPPGTAKKTNKPTEYGRQLREKQALKRMYGITERQLQGYYARATRSMEPTGDQLLRLVDLRVDNVAYKAGFGFSRAQVRQFITHGMLEMNGKKIKTPSIEVKTGDVISVREKFGDLPVFVELSKLETKPPKWMKVDQKKLSVVVERRPEADELEQGIASHVIVEFYSR